MPALPPNTDSSRSEVLVTGASGYVGQWVLRSLLDRGYLARIAVRSEAKGKAVKELFPEDQRKLSFVIIEDLTKTGAFDEAVVGVGAIVHVAAPTPATGETAEETIRIAKEATISLLESALKNGEEVKRIVVTSTFATIWTDQAEPRTFTENDWNEYSMDRFEAGDQDPITVYYAGKIIAEKAIQAFVQKHQHQIGWDVTVLTPPFVYGPNLHQVSSSSELLSTSKIWFQSLLDRKEPTFVSLDNGWVDVRDLGEAHALSLEREAAGGERITPSAGSYKWHEWFDVVRSLALSLLPEAQANELVKDLPAPSEGIIEYKVKIDNSKAARILGLNYRTKEEMVRDILEQAIEGGWLH